MKEIGDKTLAFRIDEEFHKRIKKRLIDNGKTLKNHVTDLLLKDLQESEKLVEQDKHEILERADEIVKLLKDIAENEKK